MEFQNCWEFKKCGREIGGVNVERDGLCQAAANEAADGFCGGKNGGRACVYIIGTLCDGVCQRTYKEKRPFCDNCEFHLQLKKEFPKEMTILSYLVYIERKKEKKK
jgi:hypothetical protein